MKRLLFYFIYYDIVINFFNSQETTLTLSSLADFYVSKRLAGSNSHPLVLAQLDSILVLFLIFSSCNGLSNSFRVVLIVVT